VSRIAATFEKLARERRCALILFVTAGDPSPKSTVGVMHALAKNGADVIELGVPFSDPMADGPVIQRSSERALKNGVTLRSVLSMVAEFRKGGGETPVVLMGYANPIERMGLATFVKDAQAAGVDGVLIVDYPPEESGEWLAALKGVTGAANIDTRDVEAMMARIRKHTEVPVGVGFGIRDGATAQRIARLADAVVVGTRIVQELADAKDPVAKAGEVAAEFRSAMDKQGVHA